MRKGLVIGAVASVALVATVLVAARAVVLAAMLPGIISLSTGYHVAFAEARFASDHVALLRVHVSKRGEPVLDAARIDIGYSLHDLLPGSKHRYGIASIAIDRPVLTLIRHKDGTYNVAWPQGGGPAAAPAPPNRVPLAMTVRIRDAQGDVRAPDALDPQSRSLKVRSVNLDARIDTDAVSRYAVTGTFIEHRDEPFAIRGTVDTVRGYAMHHGYAAAVPLRSVANFFIDSNDARILAGTASNCDVRVFALDVQRYAPIRYHVSGRLDLSNGGLAIIGLARPLGDMTGRLQLIDEAFFATHLDGTLAGIPVGITGGIYDFAAPKYQLGVTARADLTKLRTLFSFAQTQPVRGSAAVGVLIEGKLASPLIVANLDGENLAYRNVPLHAVRARLAFASGSLFLAPVAAEAGGAKIALSGRLQTGAVVRSQFSLHVAAPADRLPYAGVLMGEEPVVADVLLQGENGAFYAHGSAAAARGIKYAAANFTFKPDGAVAVAPFWIHSGRGTLDGAYRLDRSHDTSDFWIVVDGLLLHRTQRRSFLQTAFPAFPEVEGTIERAAIIGGGRAGTAALAAGALRARGVRIAGVGIDALDARFAGSIAGFALKSLRATGPWGTLSGGGAYGRGTLVVQGDYRGDLERLRPMLENVPARGSIEGPVALAIAPGRLTIQGEGLTLHDATVRGVPVSQVSGTVSIAHGALHVYSAYATAAGGNIAAAGSYGGSGQAGDQALSIVASNLSVARLKGLGIPLDGGTLSADGTLAAEAPLPAFAGGIALRGGRAQRYRLTGTSDVTLGGNRLTFRNAVGAVDGTYALADGVLSALSSGKPAYDISLRVPAASVRDALRLLAITTYPTDGTFDANLAVRGRGLAPAVSGAVGVPGGSVNGLPFLDAAASLWADPQGAIVRRGHVLVGATAIAFAAARSARITGIHVRAPGAHLSDFNNFFDTGDTLHGDGNVAFDILEAGRRISSNGRIDVKALRYRNLAIGDTRANWSSVRNMVRGGVAVRGPSGTLAARGTIGLAPGGMWQDVLRDSRYGIALDLDDADPTTWSAALGFPDLPLTGRIDGDATIAGRYPSLALRGTARLRDGTAWRLPIQHLEVAFSSSRSRILIDKAELGAPGVQASATGSFVLARTAPLSLDVHASSSDLPKLVSRFSRIRLPVTGNFESTVHVGGSFAAPTFAAAFDAIDVDAYGVKIPSAFGSLRLVGRSLQLRDAGVSLARGEVTIAGALPLQLSPFRIGPPSAPVSLDLAVTGVDPSDFEVLLGDNSRLGGIIDGQIGLSGTIAQPGVSGRFDVVKGSYTSDLERTPVTGVSASLTFDRTEARVEKLHALFGAGSLDGSGRILFSRGFANEATGGASYTVNAVARRAQFDLPAYGRGAVDATLALARVPGREAEFSGNADLSDAVIPFAAFLAAAQSGTQTTPAGPPLALRFDLAMTAGKNVRVRGVGFGGGLDIGAVGAVHLQGDLAAPTLDGEFTSTGGTLTYFDRAFRVQSGTVAFSPASGIVPALHATGTTHVVNPDPDTSRNPYGSAEITISVDGPVNNLKVAFDSNPPGYSKEQILAMIAPFGGFINGIGYAPGIDESSGITGAQLGALAPVPGSTLRSQTGTITVGQEAFSVLNAQFTAGLLGPLENAVTQGLGFQDFSLTVDYFGNVGFSARRLLGRTVSFVYASTFGLPTRESFGLELQGNDATSAALSFFFQNGPTRLFDNPHPNLASNGRLSAGEALQGDSGFSFTLQRLYW
ncbi:MAG: translocation/assembly module TamB [Candidatus Eremiobacteraeota bacterium]|nr:translocation/assembly module TamB [Candidatus Eremiobacteraeota bacterium]